MNFKSIALATTLTAMSSVAFATPQYTGQTTADYGIDTDGATSALAVQAHGQDGYYLWNDEANTDQWHLRWTSPNASVNQDFFGNIQFRDSNLGNVNTFRYEGNDLLNSTFDDPFFSGGDAFTWEAKTNHTGGMDGIDFTIASDIELMSFSLGSTLFSNLPTIDDPGAPSTGIYIGGAFNGTNALVVENAGETYQQFEIKVPEPTSLALFGLGLAGLGMARRKQSKA